MNMNQKPKNSLTTLIIMIILSIVMPPIAFYLKGIPVCWSFLLSAIMIAYFIYAFLKEKKDDKKADKLKSDFLDGSYFSSVEWREKYLNYMQSYQFDEINPKGMKADLSRRYRKTASVPFMLFGILMIIGAGCGFFVETENKILQTILTVLFGAGIGAGLIYIEFEKFTAKPVKKFYKGNYDFKAIESSYENGKMLSHKEQGINIGSSYTVIYNKKIVFAIDNKKI